MTTNKTDAKGFGLHRTVANSPFLYISDNHEWRPAPFAVLLLESEAGTPEGSWDEP